MLKYDYVNAVYCELDALMYVNIKQMIYEIDLETMDFKFIERNKVCKLLTSNKENVLKIILFLLFKLFSCKIFLFLEDI